MDGRLFRNMRRACVAHDDLSLGGSEMHSGSKKLDGSPSLVSGSEKLILCGRRLRFVGLKSL